MSVRLNGSFRKGDIVERLVGMVKIRVTRKPEEDDSDSEVSLSIFYITEEVKLVLQGLPSFSDVVEWEKKLSGVLLPL